jgi:hypothetical protein
MKHYTLKRHTQRLGTEIEMRVVLSDNFLKQT